MSETVIKVENLSKQYRLGVVGTGTLSHDLNRWWHKVRGKEDPYLQIGETNDRGVKGKSQYVWSLKGINFEVKQGEVLGIIGKNGAGKSTLLKLLSRVTSPTTGEIKAKGRIASLLEVGTGFHPELTGRENIFLNGAILGMTRAEIRRKLDEIIEFSGTARYIDTPVKRYSSGMKVRLAFAVAAHLEPEILIVDEVLAVGDAEFQKKAIGKMQDVTKSGGRTVLFVSHDLNAVSQICKSGIVLDKGLVGFNGPINEAIGKYLNQESFSPTFTRSEKLFNQGACIERIVVKKSEGTVSDLFKYDEPINVEFNIKILDEFLKASLFITILDHRKRRIFSCESHDLEKNMKLKIEPSFLVRGNYSLHAFINIPKVGKIDNVEDVCNFKIQDFDSVMSIHGDYDYGSVFGKYSWVH